MSRKYWLTVLSKAWGSSFRASRSFDVSLVVNIRVARVSRLTILLARDCISETQCVIHYIKSLYGSFILLLLRSTDQYKLHFSSFKIRKDSIRDQSLFCCIIVLFFVVLYKKIRLKFFYNIKLLCIIPYDCEFMNKNYNFSIYIMLINIIF